MDPVLALSLVLAALAVGVTFADAKHRLAALREIEAHQERLNGVLAGIQSVHNSQAEAFQRLQDTVAAHEMKLSSQAKPSGFARPSMFSPS